MKEEQSGKKYCPHGYVGECLTCTSQSIKNNAWHDANPAPKETIADPMVERVVEKMTLGMDDALAGFSYGGISGADYFRSQLRQSLLRFKEEVEGERDKEILADLPTLLHESVTARDLYEHIRTLLSK